MFYYILMCFVIYCYVVLNTQSAAVPCPVENLSVKKFREYIQIDTSQPANLDKAVEFWRRQANEIGMEFAVYRPDYEPICVLTWRGANPSLPSIMLNAHMDVVPVDPNLWSYPPFGANVDESCNIYGRGTQDTKDVAIQYLEAISRLKENNITLQRTIHITLMPDEETGAFKGMRQFLKTKEFKDLNVRFALDEGLCSAGDHLYATYQDRRVWVMNFTVEGTAGHGFVMPDNIAIKKLRNLLNIMMEFREPLEKAVIGQDPLEYGSYTTMNINMVNGGLASNIIPGTFNLIADLRLSPIANVTEILSVIKTWLTIAGTGTKVEYVRQEMESLPTSLDKSNPFWLAMKCAIEDMGFSVRPIVNPATSDILFVRNLGIPAVGFAPKFRTTSKIHGENEYLNIHTFLRGIDVYVAIIEKIANIP